MKKGISYWSFPGGLENTAPYGPVFRKAAKLGFDSVECAYDAAGVRRSAVLRRITISQP